MEATQEIAVTSCLNDSIVSVHAWDVHTGTSLMTYRGDCPVTPSGVSLLGGQYVVAALQDKPFLRVWPVNSQHSLTSLRLVCSGRVTHAQASPDGCYIAITVAERLDVFQVASGRLVGSGVRHFQPIRVVRWSPDGNMVVCGGDDGLVTVWSLGTLIAPHGSPEPRYVLADHVMAVTDLVVTSGSRSRLLTVSSDRTCKIYDLSLGTLLISLVFDKMLTAVATSTLETEVFLGTDSGAILEFSLLSLPRQLEYHLSPQEAAPVFSGHDKGIRSLQASAGGTLLMSGSADGTVKLWHIGTFSSRQCVRTFVHKGPVTNAFFAPKPKQMFDNELRPDIVLNSFQTANSEKSDCVEVMTGQSLLLCDNRTSESAFSQSHTDGSGYSEDRIKSLQMEINLLKSINLNLYKFAVNKIIDGDTFSPQEYKEVVKSKKRKKKKNNFADKLLDNVTNNKNQSLAQNQAKNNKNVPAPVNGLSNKKKRKKRNKKNVVKKK